jgi:hypothetical protein
MAISELQLDDESLDHRMAIVAAVAKCLPTLYSSHKERIHSFVFEELLLSKPIMVCEICLERVYHV